MAIDYEENNGYVGEETETETETVQVAEEIDLLDIEQTTQKAEEDYFESPLDTKYPQAVWHKGYNPILERNKEAGKIRGIAFDYAKMPEDFNLAMEKVQASGKAKLVSVKHKKGDVVDYWVFDPSVKFYPLTIGVSALEEIRLGKKILGFSYGITSKFLKETNECLTSNRYGCLFVVDALQAAGYVDKEKRNLPKPIVINLTSYTGKELYKNVFLKQAALVQYARKQNVKVGKDKDEIPMPYMYGVQFQANKDASHGSIVHDQSEAAEVNCTTPSRNDLDISYLEKMYCGDALLVQLKRMLIIGQRIDGVVHLVPGGPAIKWCEESILWMQANQEKYIRGGKPVFGKTPAPLWMIREFSRNGDEEIPQDIVVRPAITSTVKSNSGGGKAMLKIRAQSLAKFLFTKGEDETAHVMLGIVEGLDNGECDEEAAKEMIAIAVELKKQLEVQDTDNPF